MAFIKPGTNNLEPMFLVMVAIMIGGALYGLNKVNIWFAPAILVFCCAAMMTIWFVHRREEKRAELQIRSIDYDNIAQRDLAKYGPWLKENVRGQDQVIDEIIAALEQRFALAKPGRTLGNFLLVGPTGTGKTFLSQLIGQAVFPDSPPVILRMNQYKHADDVFTLNGPPPGSPGYEVGGALTRPVLENPKRVVILDELEKAHKDLQHCLYDILDVAVCREKSSGRMVDFSGCIFFATCNAAVDELRNIRSQTSDPSAWFGRSRDALVGNAGFDKAFLSRWNGIYLMDELAPIHIAEVACLQLARQWREYGIEVSYASPGVLLDAVQRNEDFKEYGVRQLGAYIQEKLGPLIRRAKRNGRYSRRDRNRQRGRTDAGESIGCSGNRFSKIPGFNFLRSVLRFLPV
ncbi:MAG: AAA family ATPase [Verrucomicrobiota bacterium]|nr:AAA family ATPase [Verrucomicrobiota bacterium]